jgi:hypothetical protein
MKRQHDGMTRTQIQLAKDQYESLRTLAARRGVSMAQLVREGVEAVLAGEKDRDPWADVLEIVGKYGRDEPPESVGREHDRYLDEGFGDWREST